MWWRRPYVSRLRPRFEMLQLFRFSSCKLPFIKSLLIDYSVTRATEAETAPSLKSELVTLVAQKAIFLAIALALSNSVSWQRSITSFLLHDGSHRAHASRERTTNITPADTKPIGRFYPKTLMIRALSLCVPGPALSNQLHYTSVVIAYSIIPTSLRRRRPI